jgi:hypothetical protein
MIKFWRAGNRRNILKNAFNLYKNFERNLEYLSSRARGMNEDELERERAYFFYFQSNEIPEMWKEYSRCFFLGLSDNPEILDSANDSAIKNIALINEEIGRRRICLDF